MDKRKDRFIERFKECLKNFEKRLCQAKEIKSILQENYNDHDHDKLRRLNVYISELETEKNKYQGYLQEAEKEYGNKKILRRKWCNKKFNFVDVIHLKGGDKLDKLDELIEEIYRLGIEKLKEGIESRKNELKRKYKLVSKPKENSEILDAKNQNVTNYNEFWKKYKEVFTSCSF